MANQRKKTKVHVGGYYERELKDELVKSSRSLGIPMSQLLEKLIRNFCFGRQLN